MTIATWNVNSVRARLGRVLDWLSRREPDLVALQETKVVDEDFPRQEIESLGYGVEAYGQKTYNGVALLSRAPLTDVRRGLTGDDPDARVIGARVEGVRVLDLYVPNGQEVGSEKYAGKLLWLDRLRERLEKEHSPTEPLLLCGDFNIAPDDRDVYDPRRWKGKVLCSEPERERFRKLLEWGLVDALRSRTEEGGIYTWWDYRLSAFQKDRGLRIDHFLVTPALMPRVRSVTVDREERAGKQPSDHAPVLLELSP